MEELEATKSRLDEAGTIDSGILVDRYGGREFIWLDEPDRFRIEFYHRPQ